MVIQSPLIQLALDLVDERKAFRIASKCKAYVDILEAGTPLIKAYGIKVVKELKRFGLPVSADMKTFDAGELEATIAAENGADYATVLAAANDTTLKDFISSCRRYGVKSVSDLMRSPLERALFLKDLGVDYIAVHSGLDEQKSGVRPFDDLMKLKNLVSIPLVVAGGVREQDLVHVAPYAEIVVIGSAITKAGDPAEASRRIRKTYIECKALG